MPPFPERESSILAKLKKKKPSSVPDASEEKREHKLPQAQMSNNVEVHVPPVINANVVSSKLLEIILPQAQINVREYQRGNQKRTIQR